MALKALTTLVLGFGILVATTPAQTVAPERASFSTPVSIVAPVDVTESTGGVLGS